jgi:hypothetical protein
MKSFAFALVGFVLTCLASGASAQSPGNAHQAWSGVYTNPSAGDQALRNNQALLDFQLRNGIINPGASNVYNGTVNQTYTGPNSSSGSNVMNIDNLNSTTTNTTALGGSKVNVTTSTSQKADGSTQSGAATSNSATIGKGVFDANNNITTGN